MTATGGAGRVAPGTLARLCRATCEQGPFGGAAIFTWEDGEPLCLEGHGGAVEQASVRQELRRDRALRRRLEAGELARHPGVVLVPLGGKRALVVWLEGDVQPSSLALARLGSLACASLEVWRQQCVERALRRRLRRMQQALARQELRTERAMRRVAHDLKAPLSAVKGYVDMMVRGMAGPLTPTMERYLERMRQAIERQRQLIDGALHAPPAVEELPDLKQFLLAALERSREALQAKRIGLEMELPSDICRTRALPSHLELLLRRMVRQMVRSAANGSILEVTLRDDGRSRVLAMRAGGAALDIRGWSICDAVARKMGGTVDVAWRGGMVLEATLPHEPSRKRDSAPEELLTDPALH